MSLVRVDAANNHVVLQYQLRSNFGSGKSGRPSSTSHASQTYDTTRRDRLNRIRHNRADTSAFDNDIWLEADASYCPGVIFRTELSYQIGLWARLDAIQDVNFETSLDPQKSCEETNRPRSSHEYRSWLPERPPANCDDVLPSLRNHSGRLKQYAKKAEGTVYLYRILRLNAPTFGHVSIDLLDASFRILAVPAHIPLAYCAMRTWNWIRTPDNTHDEIAFLKRTAIPGIDDTSKRFVSQYQAGASRRSPTVFSFNDLNIGRADTYGNRFDNHGSITRIGLGDFLESCTSRFLGFNSDRFHTVLAC